MMTILRVQRDLRAADHPALARAAAMGVPVSPLHVVEPDCRRLPDMSQRQWAFTAECLGDLRLALARPGAPLIVCAGNAVEALARLGAAHGVTAPVSHDETGTPWTFERDSPSARWARANGVAWHDVPQSGLVRRLASREGRARGSRVRRDRAACSAPMIARPAIADDAQWMGAVHTKAWRETYTGLLPPATVSSVPVGDRARHRAAAIAAGHARIAVVDGLGLAAAGPQREPALAAEGWIEELFAIYLARAGQGRGLGRALFEAVRGRHRLSCCVIVGNAAACRFCDRMGGPLLRTRDDRIGGTPIREHLYGWEAQGLGG